MDKLVGGPIKASDVGVTNEFYYNDELGWVKRGEEEEVRRKRDAANAPPPQRKKTPTEPVPEVLKVQGEQILDVEKPMASPSRRNRRGKRPSTPSTKPLQKQIFTPPSTARESVLTPSIIGMNYALPVPSTTAEEITTQVEQISEPTPPPVDTTPVESVEPTPTLKDEDTFDPFGDSTPGGASSFLDNDSDDFGIGDGSFFDLGEDNSEPMIFEHAMIPHFETVEKPHNVFGVITNRADRFSTDFHPNQSTKITCINEISSTNVTGN